MSSTIIIPKALLRAYVVNDAMFYVIAPIYVVDRFVTSIRTLFVNHFVDYNRRVDAAWAVEIMSGITAIFFATWTIIGEIDHLGTSSPVRAFEEYIPPPVWAVVLIGMAAWQIGQATWGERIPRAKGCCVALLLWAFWIVMIWIRAGYAGSLNPLIALDMMCAGACVAYYVSANPKNE